MIFVDIESKTRQDDPICLDGDVQHRVRVEIGNQDKKGVHVLFEHGITTEEKSLLEQHPRIGESSVEVVESSRLNKYTWEKAAVVVKAPPCLSPEEVPRFVADVIAGALNASRIETY